MITGIRSLLVGSGVVLLVLAVNQLGFQRWIFAAIQGVLGLGLLLGGLVSSDAALGRESRRNALGIVLSSVVFIAIVGVVAMSVDLATSDLIGLSLPYLAALWLLVLGARYANGRTAVAVVSVASGVLLLVQCAILGMGILMSPYHVEHRTQFQSMLAAVVVTGVPCLWWFRRAKRSRTT